MKKRFRKINGKPPFYWPLILAIVIVVEIGVLIKEKAWSQTYGVYVMSLRDQVEQIISQNNSINNYLYNLYSIANYELQPQRENLISESSALLGSRNESSQRY